MVFDVLDLRYLALGVLVGAPLANRLQSFYDTVEVAVTPRLNPKQRVAWALFEAVTVPLTATTFATFGGGLLGWRLSDPYVGATWAAVGGVVSPYLWPSVRKALQRQASSGIAALRQW